MVVYQSGRTGRRTWWRRPIVWLVAVVVAGLGAYLTDVVRQVLDNVASAEQVSDALSGESAISVVEVTHLFDNEVGAQGYVVPATVDAAPMRDLTQRDTARWATANGAVDYRTTAWQVTLEGTRSAPVEVVDIVPVLDGPCGAPLRGGLIDDGSEGVTDKVLLHVDIDRPNASFQRVQVGISDPVEHFFATNKITLPRGEQNVLILAATSDGPYCRWRYRIDYLADGARRSTVLSAPGGKPFEVTGPPADRAGYDWVVTSAVDQDCYGGSPDRLAKVDGPTFAARGRCG